MKIGIITFHSALNYGAVLQAYALQKVINDLGGESEIVDYVCEFIVNAHKKRCSSKKKVIVLIRNVFYRIVLDKFRKFIQKNIKLSRIQYSRKNISQANALYDSFIVGSDQVWNCRLSGFDTTYFLDFVNDSDKKNSYSASLGIQNIPIEQIDMYNTLLKSFAKISVRENTAQSILREILRRDVFCHVDPTMLLNENKWRDVAKKPNTSEKYVLLYLIDHNKEIIDFAEKYAAQNRMGLYYISDNLRKKIKAKYLRFISPEEYVGYFMCAEFVVTNSFHGLMFSIVMNKEFVCGLLPDASGVNARIRDALKLFDLERRLITSNSNNDNVKMKIDYKEVNDILEEERKKAVLYIRGILEKMK